MTELPDGSSCLRPQPPVFLFRHIAYTNSHSPPPPPRCASFTTTQPPPSLSSFSILVVCPSIHTCARARLLREERNAKVLSPCLRTMVATLTTMCLSCK
ncbi:hypothetical protein K402DRAFT_173561 [Aulographum hederae CBS 113979]|uniref:Uncharacterized protein n=1 Tax=Aulographum hederae CBS 113979 TaxID=1176131 RepID=A0A6G1HDX8_9PEZI|nr:hypothetical protein K402DRAFT_173561 [Aulographum hederae CBS 113979]